MKKRQGLFLFSWGFGLWRGFARHVLLLRLFRGLCNLSLRSLGGGGGLRCKFFHFGYRLFRQNVDFLGIQKAGRNEHVVDGAGWLGTDRHPILNAIFNEGSLLALGVVEADALDIFACL